MPAEELEKAKNYLALQLPRNFETTRGTADALAQAWIYDLPADYYTTYADRVRAVTAADVKRVADKYIQSRQARGGDRRRSQGDRIQRQGAEPGTDHCRRTGRDLQVTR